MPRPATIRPAGAAVVFACTLLAFCAPAAPADEPGAPADLARGAELFGNICADCHGERGEGVDFLYDSPLHGDLSVGRLAELIERTMPEGDPGSVVGADAAAVAAYAHERFYSRAAQLRNAPPRVELARLTQSQYRHSVADLAAAFAGVRKPNGERGLKAEYRRRGGDWKQRLAFSRVDATVDLDLGTGVPTPGDGDETGPADGKLAEGGFHILWDGAVLPPVTGEYTFVIDCTNQVQFELNGEKLVNVRVRSGDQTRYEAKAFLLAGRPTPLRLEMEKRMSERFGKTPEEAPFAGRLSWVPPHRAEAVVPTRHLLPGWAPRTLIVSTPFPPDDRSVGYERGSAVSAAWDEATTEAAFEVVDALLADEGSVRTFLGIKGKESDAEQREKAQAFCAKWAERAFRRPLTDEQRAVYVDAHFDGADGIGGAGEQAGQPRHWTDAVKRCVLMTLKSPHFLYPNLHAAVAAAGGEAPDGYDRAAALALALQDGLPDDDLWRAAAKGDLDEEKYVRWHAERMSREHRAAVKLEEFFADWLIPEGAHEMAKDESLYPGFDDAAVGDLRTSLELAVADALAADAPDLRTLWNADHLYLNARLANLYRDDLVEPDFFTTPDAPAAGTFVKLAVKPGRRAGLLTHPLLMAGYAHHRVTSPIHRGVFVARKLLGRDLKPPKEAFSPLPEDFGDGLTTRQRVAHQTADAACSACHDTINPLGFSLEQFDAIGRFRTEERVAAKGEGPPPAKPVDPAGVYPTPDGAEVTLAGADDLRRFVAESPEARTAFVERLFHHAVKQPAAAYGPDTREALSDRFEEEGRNIKAAFAAAAAVAALGPPTDDAPPRTAAADPPARN